MTKTKSSRILIVDDHPVFLDGMAALMDTEPDLEVCGKAPGIAEARTMIMDLRPDAVVLDLTLEGDSGLDFLQWSRTRGVEVPIVVASMHEDAVYVERALEEGARGYVTKRSPSGRIVEALRAVLTGRSFVDPALKNGSGRTSLHGERVDPVKTLSRREFEVFERIGQGLGTSEIARLLHRSVKTIESHRASIKRKLGIDGAVELVRYATLWAERS